MHFTFLNDSHRKTNCHPTFWLAENPWYIEISNPPLFLYVIQLNMNAIIVRRSANVNLTQLDQNVLPRN